MSNTCKKVFASIVVFAAIGFADEVKAQSPKSGTEASKIIVTVASGRVRSRPSLRSTILREVDMGSRLVRIDENRTWFNVKLPANSETEQGRTGWISKTIAAEFDEAAPNAIFQQIANKYFARKSLSFQTAVQLFEFLGPAADDATNYEVGGDLRMKRLLALSKAVRMINYNQSEISPYKEFLTKTESEVIYHEPAGMWIVQSARFWELHQQYKKYRVGETIAWQAARNPLPGECEGYLVCHLNYLRVTSGEYLNFYPSGRYSKQALSDISNMLEPVVADLPEKRNYTTASDISDRAEFNRILSELRTIVSKTPFLEKGKVLKQISQIAEGHR